MFLANRRNSEIGRLTVSSSVFWVADNLDFVRKAKACLSSSAGARRDSEVAERVSPHE